MEQPQNNSGLNSREQHREPSPAPPLSPIQGFLLCLALLVGAGLVIHFTAGSTAPPAPLNLDKTEPGGASLPVPKKEERVEGRQLLTPKQAKRVFVALNEKRYAAYRRRDLDLVPATFTSNSPIRHTVLREIRKLKRDSVVMRTQEATKKLSILSIKQGRLQLRQVAVVDAKFLQRGENITAGGALQRQVVKWVLHRDNGQWLFHNGLVLKRVNLKGKGNR